MPHQEQIEVIIEPEELIEHAGRQKEPIGDDASERLDVVLVKFRVVTRCPNYAYKKEDGVIRAPVPA